MMSFAASDPVEQILWAVLLLLLGGFMAGAWLNRRHSKAIGEWLQGGLKSLGGQTSWKWIRSMNSGAQVTVSGAAQPFRQVEVSYFLLTREFPPLWAVELLRGKRDMLAVRADLRAGPAQEFEVVPIHGGLRRMLDENAGDRPWQWQEMPAGLGLATRDGASPQVTTRVKAFLDRSAAYVQRLSLRERKPNLVLFVRLTGIENAPSSELLEALKQVVATPPSRMG
jgi:hypothetical protein